MMFGTLCAFCAFSRLSLIRVHLWLINLTLASTAYT